MKILLSILLFGMLSLGVNAQDYTSSQLDLIKSVQEFLDTEGYHPERQDDGLKFTKNGASYYVEVSKEDTAPMYLRLRRYVRYSDKLSKESIGKNINDYNVKYGVKALCRENAVVLSLEMYLSDASQFIGIFDKCMYQLMSAYRNLTE